MRLNILIISVFACISFSFGQVLKFDQMEVYYDQAHYKTVLRKANRLLDNPEYDYSLVPKYYYAIATFQLAKNEKWRKRRKDCLSLAANAYSAVIKSEKGKELLDAHLFEVSALKKDLTTWASDLKLQGKTALFNQVSAILVNLFDGVKSLDVNPVKVVQPETIIENTTTNNATVADVRLNILTTAKKQLGTPYLWGGKSKDGFDCSGFTSFVFAKEGISAARRAQDQQTETKKVKKKDLKPGDLVFFKNVGKINHVGIVYSLENNSVQMIHASSSKGISIVDIYRSTYWSKRIDSFGTYL